jgi:small subunit ribosomal protein S8e
MISQKRSLRRPSGGMKKKSAKKKLYRRGSQPTLTKLGTKRKSRTDRIRSGSSKQRLLNVTVANVYNPSEKKYVKVKIKTVASNTANRFFQRANIITKGAIIETEAGKAVVTNKPGQEGSVNAKLI